MGILISHNKENALKSKGFLLQNGGGRWRYFARVGVGTLLGGQAALARARQIRELQPFSLRSKVLPQRALHIRAQYIAAFH